MSIHHVDLYAFSLFTYFFYSVSSTEMVATTCAGKHSCSDALCVHGVASNFVGYCQCLCAVGYAGADCGQCAKGFTGYPACTAVSGQVQVQVWQLQFSSSAAQLAADTATLQQRLDEVFGTVASVAVSHICPAAACAYPSSSGHACNGVHTVAQWAPSRAAQCAQGAGNATRSGAVLTDAASVVEVLVTYNNRHALHPGVTNDRLMAILEEESMQNIHFCCCFFLDKDMMCANDSSFACSCGYYEA